MKTRIINLFLFSAIVALTSCGKSQDLEPNPIFDAEATGDNSSGTGGSGSANNGSGITKGTMVATIDGTATTFTTLFFSSNGGFTFLTGSNSEKQIGFTFIEELKAGSKYTLGTTNSATYTPDNANTDPTEIFSASSGSLTVNSVDVSAGTISATFSFTGDNGKSTPETAEITNGKVNK